MRSFVLFTAAMLATMTSTNIPGAVAQISSFRYTSLCCEIPKSLDCETRLSCVKNPACPQHNSKYQSYQCLFLNGRGAGGQITAYQCVKESSDDICSDTPRSQQRASVSNDNQFVEASYTREGPYIEGAPPTDDKNWKVFDSSEFTEV